MDSLSAREWVGVALLAVGGVWTIAQAVLTFRRTGRRDDSAEARESAARLKADTIAEYMVLYNLKCQENEALKREKGDLVDKLTAERITSGGLAADKRNLADDLRQAQRELRELRRGRGPRGAESPPGDGDVENPGG